MTSLDKFFGNAGRAFPVTGDRKGAELSQREVARKHGNDVEKTSLGLGVTQASDSLDVNVGNLHMCQNLLIDSHVSHLACGA